MTDTEYTPQGSEVDRNQRQFEAVFDSPDSLIGVLNPDGTLRRANQTALAFIDATPADVEGTVFWNTPWFAHDEELQQRIEGYLMEAAGGDYVRFEATLEASDGEEIAVDSVIRPVTDGDETVVSLIVEGRDITERKRYEDRLKAIDEATHRLLTADTRTEVAEIVVDVADTALNHPMTAMWRYESDTGQLVPLAATVTAAELDNTQTAADEIGAILGGTTEMDVFHEGELTIIEDYQQVDAPAHPENPLRTLLIAPLGEYGQLHVGSRSVEEIDETARELIEILARNATGALERIERERTLNELHRVTRRFMQADSPQEVASLAVEAGRDILGLSFTHLYELAEEGQTLKPVVVSDEMDGRFGRLPEFEKGEGMFWKTLEEGAVKLYNDVQVEGELASDLPFRGAIIAPLGEHGVFGSASLEPAEFDVFDRELASLLAAETETAFDAVKRQQALRRRERDLERQNGRLEEFTNVVSHDLRNPLNVALGRLAFARQEYESEHLDSVAEALERMESLIEDTLTLARQGRTIDELSPIALATVVEAAWETTKTGNATIESDDDLGTVMGDGDRIQELLENLFRNAVEHGGGDVTVRVGKTSTGFFVADNGSGLPEDEWDDVFDHGFTTSKEGTGLGLAIVKRIVDAHGWEVTGTESTAGGARFEITVVD